MIDNVLYDYVYDNITFSGDFVYGSAENLTAPYIIMYKITDPEQKQVLCDTQGDTGEALFQFSAYAGNTGDAANSLSTVQYLQAFKEQIKTIRGTIGTLEQYRIDQNVTGGVRVLGEGSNTLNTWGAFFETTIRWVKL